METDHLLVGRAAVTYSEHSIIEGSGTLSLKERDAEVRSIDTKSNLDHDPELGETPVRVGAYSQRLLAYKAGLQKQAKALDAYTWQKGDAWYVKIWKVAKWILSLGIAPLLAYEDASIAKSALKRHYDSLIIAEIPFKKYDQSTHFTNFREDPEAITESMFNDLNRKLALYNRENPLEQAWRNLQSRHDLPHYVAGFTSYFEAMNVHGIEENWGEIERLVKKEFQQQVFPRIMEELGNSVSLLGGLTQASTHVFTDVFKELVGPEGSTARRKEDGTHLIRNRGKVKLYYKGLFVDQAFGNNQIVEGKSAYQVFAIVDFKKQTVDLTIRQIKNPHEGREIPSI